MFSIEQDFEDDFLDNLINSDVEEIINELADTMFETGKRLVDRARAKTKTEGGFNNITWNLRASIGCVLVNNHEIQEQHIYFPPLAESSTGHETGVNLAREVAILASDGDPVLILVAGEHYGVFVEAKGRDVITLTSEFFDPIFKQLLAEVQ
ncbi:hypothetical protein ACVWYG_000717 [Pedobacter sp. UYEF25]